MPPQIFKNRVIATAGPLPGNFTSENLKRWTLLRKGRFSIDFDETVTHLLCTHAQFAEKVPRIKEALQRGKRFYIVHYDWFEFCTVLGKRLPEKEYSMRELVAEQNAIRREKARVEKGKRDGEKFVNTNYFHIYKDREFFTYQVDITRDDNTSGELGQRYTLCLWESNAKPHLYWFTAKFLKRKGNSQPTYHRPSPCSGKWADEMEEFTEFFRIKTGISWKDRVLKEQTMPGSFFQYSPPRGGKPVGRRLQFSHEYCLEINAKLRGLPWPPVEDNMMLDAKDAQYSDPKESSTLAGEEDLMASEDFNQDLDVKGENETPASESLNEGLAPEDYSEVSTLDGETNAMDVETDNNECQALEYRNEGMATKNSSGMMTPEEQSEVPTPETGNQANMQSGCTHELERRIDDSTEFASGLVEEEDFEGV